MNQPVRILPDLTTESAAFCETLRRVIDPVAMDRLCKMHPDGVGLYHICDAHQIPYAFALKAVDAGEAAGFLKGRMHPDRHEYLVWLPRTMPPLSRVEKLVLRQAQRDLAEAPGVFFVEGAMTDLGVGSLKIREALNFLVFADLLTREGKAYALTSLGRTEGEAA
ncbi:MAG: hypothetical protein K5905_27880 [Roseibium sp.]|uniref:hypothetical protein n=1 Tax=Roseibium sp. TaxID=1936156 RepID=UPI00262F9A38|nr:hypothetical protein [Roseibium sp.]MCV0429287.1 hypothetical protein [Roseibium sp.]